MLFRSFYPLGTRLGEKQKKRCEPSDPKNGQNIVLQEVFKNLPNQQIFCFSLRQNGKSPIFAARNGGSRFYQQGAPFQSY